MLQRDDVGKIESTDLVEGLKLEVEETTSLLKLLMLGLVTS